MISNMAAMSQEIASSLERPDRPTAHDEHVTLACEDNLAFMERIHDGQMQLIVTSPPYNLGKDYEAKTSLDDYLEGQGSCDKRVRSSPPSSRINLLAGRELRQQRRDCPS